MKVCEYCGKEIDGTYGSGRFCNRSCSNGWVSSHQSEDAKRRKIEAGIGNLVHDKRIGCCSENFWTEERRNSLKETMNSPEVSSKISQSLIKFYKNHPDYPSLEIRNKISEGIKKSIEQGRRPGYLSIKNSESYPEKYWSEVLDSLSIKYIREFKVVKSEVGIEGHGCYFLDFLLNGNIDLEIDGSQHYGIQQKQHDEIRDSNLRKAGYIVYRIKWRNPRINGNLIKEDIDNFIKWYYSEIDKIASSG